MSRSDEKTSKRTFNTARIVALVLIGVVVLGLAYLRFSPGSGAVSVPAGAHAGQLTLKSCNYTTENGTSAADCGTLVVPENRHDPNSRLIALPVTVIRAHSAHPGVPIFRLQGGPGLTNMSSQTPVGSPPSTTSCSSATAASTDRPRSTARR